MDKQTYIMFMRLLSEKLIEIADAVQYDILRDLYWVGTLSVFDAAYDLGVSCDEELNDNEIDYILKPFTKE